MNHIGGQPVTQTEIDKLFEQLEFEESRREPFKDIEKGNHETIDIFLNEKGITVKIDKEIAPLVIWLNNFPGVQTEFSCQGESYIRQLSQRPHILFFCSNQETIIKLTQIANSFGKEKSVFPPTTCDYFRIEIQIEWCYKNTLRYKIVWPDKIAMNDFKAYINV